MNKIAVLQPSYIPWLGYFEQIMNVDIFVFYDDVQYTKNDWRNRNQIKAHEKSIWLSVPVIYASQQKINQVLVDDSKKWRVKHLKTMKQYYSKTKYFEEVFCILDKCLSIDEKNIGGISINIIKEISSYLGIQTKFYRSSELGIEGERNSRLLDICKYFEGDTYYSGKAAQTYLDVDLFENNEIKVKFQDYQHPIYHQEHGAFIPYLSVIDLLFNHGKESVKIIKGEQ